MRPGRHSAHRAGRAVAVVDFERQVFLGEIGLHQFERVGCLAAQDAFAGSVAGERVAGEIVGGRIAHVLRDAGVDVAQIDKAGREHLARVQGRGEEEGEEEGEYRRTSMCLSLSSPASRLSAGWHSVPIVGMAGQPP